MVWLQNIRKRALLSKAPVTAGRSTKMNRALFNDLVFVPSQISNRPVDYFREKIESKTVIGKNSKKPLILNTPIFFAAMSFGALSKEALTTPAKVGCFLSRESMPNSL